MLQGVSRCFRADAKKEQSSFVSFHRFLIFLIGSFDLSGSRTDRGHMPGTRRTGPGVPGVTWKFGKVRIPLVSSCAHVFSQHARTGKGLGAHPVKDSPALWDVAHNWHEVDWRGTPPRAGCFLPVAWSPILQWRRRSWRLNQQRARYSCSDNEVCSRDQQVQCENVPEVCLCSWDGLWKWIVDVYFGRRVEEWHHICLFFVIAWLVPSPGLKPSCLKPRAVILCNWNRLSPTRPPLKSKARVRATLY